MRSNTVVDVLTRIESIYKDVAALRLDGLSRTELYALIEHLDKLDQQLAALDQKLFGRLLADTASSPRDVARRLRISPGEAQRRLGRAS
ncbi:hypothetical protein SAMN04489835_1456 [Mycolicibacterium rutilum]|uniref:Sigma-70, region 4 n=1 Tax=Mycolicibacterium rutilum TaxID=370526 RepID=A0A1H6J2S9_MYCRU|nr:hypothetical protein [Mycolicibacterium rutilum]SEH56211.1 hypothetical protein SAMN04489835_1456 [Mycolicibacterium rutilum]